MHKLAVLLILFLLLVNLPARAAPGNFDVSVTQKQDIGVEKQADNPPQGGNININYHNAMIDDILSVLAMQMGKNILFIEKPVVTSFELLNVPPMQALQSLLEKEGLSYIERGNTLIVGQPAKLKEGFFDQIVLTELRLNYIKATDFNEYLKTLGVQVDRIAIEGNEHSIWVRGLPQELAIVTSIKNTLDQPENVTKDLDLIRIDLKYISPDYLGKLVSGLDMKVDILAPEKGKSVVWARGKPEDLEKLKKFVAFVDDPANQEEQLPLQRIDLKYITSDVLLDVIKQAKLELDVFTVKDNPHAVWVQGTKEKIDQLNEMVKQLDTPDNHVVFRDYDIFVYELENTVPSDVIDRIQNWGFNDLKIIGFNFADFGNDILVICPPELRSSVIKALDALDGRRRQIKLPVMVAEGANPKDILSEWADLLVELLRDRGIRSSTFHIPNNDLLGGTGEVTPGGRIKKMVMYAEASPDQLQLIVNMLKHLNAPDVLEDESAKKSTAKITLEQFYKVEIGMSYDEVVKILGSPGRLMTESKDDDKKLEVYVWDGTAQGSYATLTFTNGVLSGKEHNGLE